MLNSKMMNNFDELVEDDGADSKAIDKICSPEDSMAAFTAGFGAALVATFGVAALGVALGPAFLSLERRPWNRQFFCVEGVAIGELTSRSSQL